jgi:hypothetical protein
MESAGKPYFGRLGSSRRSNMRGTDTRVPGQQNKRAMQRLAELNSNRGGKGKGARPTRKDAENECVVM